MANLFEVGVMFAALAALGVVASRLRASVIPLYVGGGLVLSPSVAGDLAVGGVSLPTVTPTEFVDLGAELGIVFLLFYLGLEFNLERLLASRAQIWRAGGLDFAVNFGAGLVLGWLLFGEPLPTLLVAGVVYISSSAVVTKSLIDLGWIADSEAEPILGTLVFEDLVIAVYLAVAVALTTGGGGVGETALAVGRALGFLVLLLVVVQFGTGLLERALSTPSVEFTVLRVVGITVLVAGAALAVGVSEAVAAFFVGMGVAGTTHQKRVEELLEPVRDVFAAVFFFWIGLETDPRLFADVAGFVLVAALVTTPTKLVSGYLGGRAYGLSPRRSARVGVGLVPRGEFSLIIGTIALAGSGLTLPAATAETLYAFAVGYVLLMSVVGTTLMGSSGPFERFATRRLGGSPPAERG